MTPPSPARPAKGGPVPEQLPGPNPPIDQQLPGADTPVDDEHGDIGPHDIDAVQ